MTFKKEQIQLIEGEKMRVLLLSEDEIAESLSIVEVMKVVEYAFKEKALGYAQMPSKVYLNFLKYNGDVRAMPAYMERLDIAAVKIVNSHPENPKKYGLPTVSGTIMLLDPKNGSLLSVMGGNNITSMRTAAAGGIAAKYLANRNSKVAGFIGAGIQARTQLLALLSVFPSLEEVRVWDLSANAAETFISDSRAKTTQCRFIHAKKAIEAVSEVDIVVTTTPSREPLVMDSWVSAGTHFNCIGADAPFKEELDSAILKRAKIVVDDLEQASHSGEINVPISRGILSRKDIWAELGEIVTGTKPARTSGNEITVFDSTGLAIQDAVTAELVYKKAVAKKTGCFITI